MVFHRFVLMEFVNVSSAFQPLHRRDPKRFAYFAIVFRVRLWNFVCVCVLIEFELGGSCSSSKEWIQARGYWWFVPQFVSHQIGSGNQTNTNKPLLVNLFIAFRKKWRVIMNTITGSGMGIEETWIWRTNWSC